jgi:catechol 2,3-dioxygenase-like lactoylglutathione lyase family enzyme
MSTQADADGAATTSGPATVPLRLEAIMLGISDVDRAKAFYERIGWRLDADFDLDDHTRIVQFTPPQSGASIHFGTNVYTRMTPGSQESLLLVVDDIQAAVDELRARGAEVSDVWHGRGFGPDGHVEGPDPDGGSYGSFAAFEDPDGNRYMLQEIRTRLPGREW